jgi:hypothetical protein
MFTFNTLLSMRFGHTSEDSLNLKSFYQAIGFDTGIWSVDNLDVSNGIYPTIIRPNKMR